jgi:GT2 family glycosyltransferase
MGSPVLIVIVNYRTSDLAVECLRSIAAEAGDPAVARVAVVDNHSNDGSVDRLRSAIAQNGWSRWAELIASDRNGGFAAGNNLAIRAELARPAAERAGFVLLLNPDTMVRPGALRELLAFMKEHPEAGIAGSRIEDAEGRSQGSARRFPSPLGELESAARLGPLTRLLRRHSVPMREGEQPMRCDWVSGAAMMIRADVFSKIGLLDEGYFLYYEELDFCHRAATAGWQIWFVPGSRVVHYEGASTGIRNRRRRRPGYWFESRRRYFVKLLGAKAWLLADCCWAAGRLIWTAQKLSGFVACRDGDPIGFAADLIGGDWKAWTSGRWRAFRELPAPERGPGNAVPSFPRSAAGAREPEVRP